MYYGNTPNILKISPQTCDCEINTIVCMDTLYTRMLK